MITPYHHPDFETYLSNTVHPAAKDAMVRSLSLIAAHYQTDAVVNEYVTGLLTKNNEDVLNATLKCLVVWQSA